MPSERADLFFDNLRFNKIGKFLSDLAIFFVVVLFYIFASEGALIGGGFSLMGKPLAVGLKYGIFKPGMYAAGMGLRAADAAVVKPLSFVLSRTPGLQTGARKLRDISAFTTEKIMTTP